MGPAAPSDTDRTIPVGLRPDEPVAALAPPEVTRALIVLVAVAAALGVLVVMFSLPDKPAAGAAALSYLALAVAAAALSLAPPGWLLRALISLMFAAAGVMAFAAVQLDLGLAAPSFPVLSLMVCVLGATAGWRAGVALALGSAAAVLATAWAVHPVAPMPGASAIGLQLGTHLLAIAIGAVGGAILARLVSSAVQSARKREQRFQRLLALAADVYWEIDADYRLVAAGQQRMVMDPLDRERGLGVIPWELEPFGCSPETLDQLLADLGTRTPFRDLPFTWRGRDGTLRSYLGSGEPRLDARGVFKGYWGVARDITAVQAAQAELQATETRYQELFGHIPTPLVLHRRGRVIDANPAAVHLFGYAKLADMLGSDLLVAYDDESRERARQRIEQLRAMPEGAALTVANFQLVVRGKRVAVQASGVRVQVRGGPALLSIYVDMTERLAAEDAVRSSEALLTHLVATSPDLITLTDVGSGRYAMVNQAFEQISGWSAAEAVGRTSLDLGIWGSPAAREQFVAMLREQGRVADLAVTFVRKDGQPVPLRVSAARFVMDQRDYMVINARDVSVAERDRLEREAILNNASIGIAVTRDRQFVLANPHFEKMFGWAEGELIGQPGEVVWLSAEDHADVGRTLGPALARGEAVELERHGRRKDGSSFLMHIRGRAIDPARPAAGGTAWIAEDVTGQRQSEQALARARDEAQAANRAKSAFLANTSHELRTPLNGMIGLARMACAPGVGEAQRQRYLDQIADSAQSLAAIISDILDLSKIEAGKLQIEITSFDLTELLATLEHTYRTLASARGLTLAFELDPGLHGSVSGDPLRLRQIVTNFLSNAIKFTAQGSVHLQAHRLGNGAVRIEVRDTGPGISAATLEGLFKPFTQADQSTTRRFGGTGLGLSICRELAGLMGGQVGVQSEFGSGSRFWAELPLPACEAATPSTPAAALASLEGMRVLLAEDNPVNMMIAVAMLENWGAEVTQVDNGAEAIEAVQRSATAGSLFDAVLMDVQMPLMGGHEATRILRQTWGSAQLPIIALTAAALVTEREDALRAGMDDFLTKPIDAKLLRAALLRLRSDPP